MSAMDEAWMVLKEMRQSKLGEYHEDFPSPYGEVTQYHGTGEAYAPSIQRQGLQPRFGNYGHGVYMTPDLAEAQYYSRKHRYGGLRYNGQEYQQSEPVVFGVRGNQLPIEPMSPVISFLDSAPVPPQQLVRIQGGKE
tara:strand:+ start:74 stop:484 length:411 start_codon:yes stop_codon:yes gene_type:complete